MGRFLSILSNTLDVSLLRNLLLGKWVIQAGCRVTLKYKDFTRINVNYKVPIYGIIYQNL